MKLRLAIAAWLVVSLTDCAGTIYDPACLPAQCTQSFEYGLVTRDGVPVTAEGRARKAKDEEARRRKAQEAENERQRQMQDQLEAQRLQALARAEQEKRAEAQRQALRARVTDDEARGYKHTAFRDLFLDYKTVPIGTKRAVSDAVYRRVGELETLTNIPPIDGAPRIVLLTEGSPREVRARLLEQSCRLAFCRGTFLGHTTRCAISGFGRPYREDVCFVIDEMW